MEGLHQGLRMPGLYQKEDDKVAEYNNDGPTMIRRRYVRVAIKRPLRTIRISSVTSMSPSLLTIIKEPRLLHNHECFIIIDCHHQRTQ